MAAQNTVYENFVLESQLKDNLTTAINHRALMKIDNSLALEAGMTKKINLYSYTGKVEKLTKGQANSTRGKISFETKSYDVKVAQEVFDYADEEFMMDPTVVDNGVKGGANLMVNDIVADFYTEAKKAELTQQFPQAGFDYDSVVDAIAKMNLESEEGLVLLVSPALKAEIRKCPDFKSKELGQVIADGAIGTLAGLPVIVSKAVEEDTAYVLSREAITLFIKKEPQVEQERDGETRTNTIIMRQVNLVALTDATKIVKMTRALA